jgi:hypothetical protein
LGTLGGTKIFRANTYVIWLEVHVQEADLMQTLQTIYKLEADLHHGLDRQISAFHLSLELLETVTQRSHHYELVGWSLALGYKLRKTNHSLLGQLRQDFNLDPL